jgi:2-polyprenyl-3-methyl-5-hydroxy-6-metoxy-1,4-benzoquinol methylase
MPPSHIRNKSYGQDYQLSVLDRFGVWLSSRKIRSTVANMNGLSVADFGCGFNASFIRSILGNVKHAFVVDVALADDLKSHPRISAIEGKLPDALKSLGDRSIDLIVCNNVIEHLWSPLETLTEFHRLVAPDGCVFVNVPSWRGKWALELAAFRLGMAPASEMNDHKMYYDANDIWPLLVRAGFIPQHIRVGKHKFGFNTYAICRVPGPDILKT